jgi:hypothetical protein
MSIRPKVLAVDLDGTILHDEFPAKGDPIDGMKEQLEALRELGWKIVIWTVRDDNEGVAKHLKKHGVPFDYINENPFGPPKQSRKIYADAYLDDRAIPFSGNPKNIARTVSEFKTWDRK